MRPSTTPRSPLVLGWAVVLAFLAGTSTAHAADDPAASRGFDVLHYAATIEPDITSKTVAGRVRIRFRGLADRTGTLEFDRGELTIDRVRDGATMVAFDELPRRVRIRLPRPLARGATRDVEIDYHGAPRFGLEFVPERSQVYTIFSTSQWLVCIDAPDERATLDLRVVLPKDLRAVGSGHVVGMRVRPDGTVLHEWRQEQPVPSYLYGFAAGRFVEATARRRGVDVRFLGEGLAAADLARALGDTPDMLAFFAEKAGVRYADGRYTHVLVARTAGQEASGFAMLSDAYGKALLDTPPPLNLSAHEVAHQWWGNLVTCREWTHFWLNEGFATFMAAAYDEHRFGRDAYLRDIENARTRYEQVRTAGGDRSLVFPSWDRPTANDRTLVYQKGAFVLHQLRETLGDDVFWAGIRRYTRAYAGRSVTTTDFQRSMEHSSGRDLSDFFSKWIYLTG
jgi:aminopeptidase N